MQKKDKSKDLLKNDMEKRIHPWRSCPSGKHWRRAHPRTGTDGVRGHCVTNPSRKDQIYPEELIYIANSYFEEIDGPPINHALGYPQGNKYDHLIRGWTKYWNEVLKPSELLDTNLVKALIATESRFKTTAEAYAGEKAGMARGLMQVTDETVKILKDEKGELRDYLINLDQEDMKDANLNIAAGVRWLFRKKELATVRLKRPASWFEAALEYKSYLNPKTANPVQIKKLKDHYEELKSRWEKLK